MILFFAAHEKLKRDFFLHKVSNRTVATIFVFDNQCAKKKSCRKFGRFDWRHWLSTVSASIRCCLLAG